MIVNEAGEKRPTLESGLALCGLPGGTDGARLTLQLPSDGPFAELGNVIAEKITRKPGFERDVHDVLELTLNSGYTIGAEIGGDALPYPGDQIFTARAFSDRHYPA